MSEHDGRLRWLIRAAGEVPPPRARNEARTRAFTVIRLGKRRVPRALVALAAALTLSVPGGALIASSGDAPDPAPIPEHTPSTLASARPDDDDRGGSSAQDDERASDDRADDDDGRNDDSLSNDDTEHGDDEDGSSEEDDDSGPGSQDEEDEPEDDGEEEDEPEDDGEDD